MKELVNVQILSKQRVNSDIFNKICDTIDSGNNITFETSTQSEFDFYNIIMMSKLDLNVELPYMNAQYIIGAYYNQTIKCAVIETNHYYFKIDSIKK